MEIGFTGTQKGMTPKQFRALAHYLLEYWGNSLANEDMWFHHGDCIGADEQAARMANNFGYLLTSHPPIKPDKRAYVTSHIMLPPKPYIDRNHDIVDDTMALIAAPETAHEVLRSGTWATIRYAKLLGRPITILNP
jgi:hypothetical protein